MRPRTNLVIAVVAAAILAAFVFRSFTRQPGHLAASKATVESCTPEAIRQVADALERSVLSANCAKLDKARAETPR
ncbi:entry exclusion lipoprotein TrbK [Pseudoduganella eburnea]|uniref:Entry exclusion lipoprotein TrbK n=1 Tax=Massilia eburnea TaxID=1776165 RepID=A0A6L6QLS5_9BURK|nr:entry exclusion lipoprotein TrbK [Massilia eburnea]MTW13332.1 entry exclusion lipoprotein TrbK [Massilia eburnea]